MFNLDFSKHQNLPWLKDNTIFLTLHGSHAYGLNHEESDIDLRGIAIPPLEYYFGFNSNFEQAIQNEPYDCTIFDIRKFFHLAAQNNPNALEIIFTNESDHIIATLFSDKIIENRNLFLSKKCRYTFEGYARSQMSRISLHRKYIINPPSHCPTRKEFNLPERTVIPQDQLNAALSQINKKLETWNLQDMSEFEPAHRIKIQEIIADFLLEMKIAHEEKFELAAKTLGYDDNFIRLLDLERQYKAKKAEWDHYQEWKKNRNPKRAEMERKYQFDCKHALHLCRLSLCCEEILTQGKLIVKRPDKDFLLSIRNGAWTYDQLMEWVNEKKIKIDEAYKNSTLPDIPDMKKLNNLCMEIVQDFLRKGT